jgi:hypothetical protein
MLSARVHLARRCGWALTVLAPLCACQLLAGIDRIDLVAASEDGGRDLLDSGRDAARRVDASRPPDARDAEQAFVCSDAGSLCDGSCVNERSDDKNCGACGSVCPGAMTCSSGACRETFEAGIEQEWSVPVSSSYDIEAVGGSGGPGGGPDAGSTGGPGGLGADVSGRFVLTQGTVLTVLVGKAGERGYQHSGGPGGGGSFVVEGSTPLVVGGGGGGGGGSDCDAGVGSPASLSEMGGPGGGGGAGGANGQGGTGSESGGGGGLLGKGTACAAGGGGGKSFEEGGAGASCDMQVPGGFGGGGGGYYCGGGGGGYSGGGGGGTGGGGGGGSFVAGSATVSAIGSAAVPGDGRVA